MISNLSFFLILLGAMMPFCLLALKNNRINLKRNIRHRQFFMPFVALVYCIVMFILVNKLSSKCLDLLDMVIRLLNRFGLTPVANVIQSLIDKWVVFVLLVVFNTLALVLYKILKRIVLAFFRSKKADRLVKNKLITLFYEYDELTGRWYIQPQFGQARTFLKTAYIGCVVLSILAILVTGYLCREEMIASPYYPVFAVILVGELYFYLNGLQKEESEEVLKAEAEAAEHVTNYALLRKPLKALFGDKLSSEGTFVNEEASGSGSIEDILQEITATGGHIGENYVSFIRNRMENGLKPDPNYVRSGYDLAVGKSLLFNTPFYYKLQPYIFYAVHGALLQGGKVLIVLGRHGIKQDLIRWCESGLFSISNIPNLWRIKDLTASAKDQEPCDIGIITRSEVHNLDAHRANIRFLREVSFVFIVEPSKLVTTAQIGLNMLIKSCGGRKDIVYCSVDRNCDGLVDSLSHILMTNLTEVSATERPRGTSSYMLWTPDTEYIQHRIVPGISRYLGMGTELSFAALKDQVERTVWYGGEAYPVLDIHWIAKQYYFDLLQYAALPATQETFDKYFMVSFNMCDERDADVSFMTVEDEQNNLFEVKRDFSTIAREQGFVNVISSDYMLREYMSENELLFLTDAKAIPYLAADFARTRRNAVLNICLRMCLVGVSEEELKKELIVLDLDPADEIRILWEEICIIFCSGNDPVYDGNGVQCITALIPGRNKTARFTREETIRRVRRYTPETGNFETFYTIADENFNRIILNDLQNATYIAETDKEKAYLGTELKGHIFQKYLPGQMFTLNGKYYEMVFVTSDNQLLIRRASEHIQGRPVYRQVRHYTISNVVDADTMGSLKTVNGIDIYNQFADFCVDTPAYWQMDSYQNFETGRLTEVNAVPRRSYFHKQILKLDFSRLGDEFTDKIRFSLTVLLNEVFRTLFAENQPYICAVTPGEAVVPMTYDLAGTETFAPSEKAIYILEDSQLDVGLLVCVERNINRIFQIIADYLGWNEEEVQASVEKENAKEAGVSAEEYLTREMDRVEAEKAAAAEAAAEAAAAEKEKKKRRNLWVIITDFFKKIFGKKNGDKPKKEKKPKKERKKKKNKGEEAEGSTDVSENTDVSEEAEVSEGAEPAEEGEVSENAEMTENAETAEEGEAGEKAEASEEEGEADEEAEEAEEGEIEPSEDGEAAEEAEAAEETEPAEEGEPAEEPEPAEDGEDAENAGPAEDDGASDNDEAAGNEETEPMSGQESEESGIADEAGEAEAEAAVTENELPEEAENELQEEGLSEPEEEPELKDGRDHSEVEQNDI